MQAGVPCDYNISSASELPVGVVSFTAILTAGCYCGCSFRWNSFRNIIKSAAKTNFQGHSAFHNRDGQHYFSQKNFSLGSELQKLQ